MSFFVGFIVNLMVFWVVDFEMGELGLWVIDFFYIFVEGG